MKIDLEITRQVEERVLSLAAVSADGKETGGILLGRGPGKKGLVEVLEAGDAGPKARRAPGFFLRDLKHAQGLATHAWERSRAIWVGEWHTHLSGDPRPSGADLQTYVGLLLSAGLDFEAFVSLIATPDLDPERGWGSPSLTAWVLTFSEGSLGPPKPLPKVGSSR